MVGWLLLFLHWSSNLSFSIGFALLDPTQAEAPDDLSTRGAAVRDDLDIPRLELSDLDTCIYLYPRTAQVARLHHLIGTPAILRRCCIGILRRGVLYSLYSLAEGCCIACIACIASLAEVG